ncbi:hypothetical protein QWJ26_36310, partial [Streptomyces sp. CSDS2]|nr:hypothetical protein [Streptomyces sp. CSDS2]
MTSEAAAVAERTEGSRETRAGHPAWARLACLYLPAPLPRDGRLAFWDPAGDPLPQAPEGTTEELTVVRRHGTGARRHRVPALTLPLARALPLLVRARRDPAAHPATQTSGVAAWPADLPAGAYLAPPPGGRGRRRGHATGVGRAKWPQMFPASAQAVAPAFATARFRIQ